MSTLDVSFAIAQCNPVVGDIVGNTELVLRQAREAQEKGANLIIFPEMVLTGYPPEDIVFKSVFQDAAMQAVEHVREASRDMDAALLVGGIWREGRELFNTAFLIEQGKVVHQQYKRDLPNHGVFDEKRIFSKGSKPHVVSWRGLNLALFICNDIWNDRLVHFAARENVDFILAMNASPYEMGKAKKRRNVCELAVRECKAPLIYTNLIGGQDELVFDGRSFALNAKGDDVARLSGFQEELGITRWRNYGDTWECEQAPKVNLRGDLPTIYQACVVGLRDYVEKNGFPGVVIGLSGGIDSGLTAAIAVDALGADRVHGILMPSPYTSNESVEDAEALAKNLGIALDTISIESGMRAFNEMLNPLLEGIEPGTTFENVQARLRGNILMAYSNAHGHMVMTTGNKSELSVGYSTLYGDMCGGYSVLKDIYKVTVYRLSEWRNQHPANEEKRLPTMYGPDGEVIPPRMISKAPSAELKPDQIDQDTLPPYEELDGILMQLIEKRASIEDAVTQGYEKETVKLIARMIYFAEYKRRQSPPGVKISGMSFGRDRRYPITNAWIRRRT